MGSSSSAFLAFMGSRKSAFLGDPFIHSHFSGFADLSQLGSKGDAAESGYDHVVLDALHTLRLIEPYLQPGIRILEVGGGVGITYLWLKHLGFDVVSIEPSTLGSKTHEVGLRMMAQLGLDSSGWLSMRAHEISPTQKPFDLIFSNNVLEHIENLGESMRALSRVLSPTGIMRHNCPNYRIPYEPHFGIPLIPGAPSKTPLLFSKLRRDPLWETIRFISARDVQAVAEQNGLKAVFDAGHFTNTFRRFDSEPPFREKHPVLAAVYSLLKLTRLFALLERLPPTWVTPMQFTLQRAS